MPMSFAFVECQKCSKSGKKRKQRISTHMAGVPYTLWCQLEDTILLIGTLLLFDPILFPKYEAWLSIGSIPNFEALLGASLIKTTLQLLHMPL